MQHWQQIASPPSLVRKFTFENFRDAFSFMTAIALEAEKMNHHPDWKNSYNVVEISLSTHSERAVTLKDEKLAQIINNISSRFTLVD
ncbi:MAG: 4a-hydroxytetrahydrobiopterin dehydratase [Leptospiraceae bacterium]|nr:4a-hydroxytetrahydrobiopterin dehydratase [Leptospiraceae bacterium]